ncbi:hypothetical protein AgCh_015961 [Apium graveolens]
MARLQQTQRKRVGSVLCLPVDVVAAIAAETEKFKWTEKCENSFQELKQRLVMAPMLALPDGKGDFVKYSDASHKGLGCVLMQHGKKELNICQRRQLELIKNNDWEILYHSGKANVVADALSKKERLKMIMSLGEFIRDFGNSSEVKVMNEGREPTNRYEINTERDDKGIMRIRSVLHESGMGIMLPP